MRSRSGRAGSSRECKLLALAGAGEVSGASPKADP
jgi:hypothetical protein